MGLQTDRRIKANKSNIIIKEKREKTCKLIYGSRYSRINQVKFVEDNL